MIEPLLYSACALPTAENCLEVVRRVIHGTRSDHNPNNKNTLSIQQYNKYYKFTFVRNPWARAYSWYRNVVRDENHRSALKIDASIPFAEFLRKFVGKGSLRPQTYWIRNFRGKIPLDFVGRFENLQSDFDVICKQLDIQSMVLPHAIPGAGEDYYTAYDSGSVQLVSEVYREEIEMFHYTFEA